MNIDTGMAVVIAAVLVFYLRLIILQREKAKRAAQALAAQPKKKKGKAVEAEAAPRYSILARSLRNRAIAVFGVALMVVGVLMNSGMFPVPAIQAWWWVPTALGILAFSWLFAL